jgi:hypothetical protein
MIALGSLGQSAVGTKRSSEGFPCEPLSSD